MSEAVIREIAQAVAKEQLLLQWEFYGLWLVLFMVLGFGAAYVGSYAKRRGEALATKADFKDLLDQLKATTAVAEEVRAQVSHSDWASRELKTLRRLKLEELLRGIHETQAWQDQYRGFHAYDSGTEPGNSPIGTINVLTGLYFPELQDKVKAYAQLHLQTNVTIMDAHMERLRAGKDSDKIAAMHRALSEKGGALYPKQLAAIKEIEAAAREIMGQLTGIGPA